MLVVDHNKYSVQWSKGSNVHPMDYAGEVVVVFDPSKSNMAMLVGTPDGTILNTIEFSGNNRKRGPAMDTTIYCEEVREFLRIYLSKVKLYMVATEQAITKEGNQYYHSTMVLTEIRSTLLSFFLDEFHIRVIEVNNWSWKAGVLPKGYRGKYEKGSKKYFQDYMPDSPYTYYFEADMTDCICIYWYLLQKHCSTYSCFCNQPEICTVPYMYYFVSANNNITDDMRETKYNPRFSIKENLDFYVNRIFGNFYMNILVDKIPVGDMYGKSVGFMLADMDSVDVKVVARRT